MNNLKTRYQEVKSKLKELLKEQEYVCITADVWSSRAQSYIGLTVHYLTESFDRKSFLLAFREIKGRQTHDILADIINKILIEFDLPNHKVTNILTDGGSAFGKAFKRFGNQHDIYVEEINEEEEESSGLPMPFIQNEDGEIFVSNVLTFGSQMNEDDIDSDEFLEDVRTENMIDGILHGENVDQFDEFLQNNEMNENSAPQTITLPPQRRCLSHLLNLVSADFEKVLNPQARSLLISAVSKVHALWTFVHRSTIGKPICVEILGCVLPVPCITRWNSRFDSINKVCQPNIKPNINRLIHRLLAETSSASHLQVLTQADWVILGAYVKVMEPIAKSLDILQGERKCCQGYIAPTLSSMRYRISNLDGCNFLKSCKKAALEVINKRFSRYLLVSYTNRDITLAAVVHPAFKTSFIENATDERKARDILRDECIKILNENQAASSDAGLLPEETGEVNDFFVSFNRTDVRRNSIESDIDAEISRYLVDRRKNEEILHEYPTIKKLFFQFNTTLSSSAPIERVFSQSNLIFRPQRNRLSAENFEYALFLKINSELLRECKS